MLAHSMYSTDLSSGIYSSFCFFLTKKEFTLPSSQPETLPCSSKFENGISFKGVTHFAGKSPPNSLDLNPIEIIQYKMKEFVRKRNIQNMNKKEDGTKLKQRIH
ncbi:hypothetical protein BpHYR1_010558 [Brachionus plicatilis]|uniref:Uncharacterized protein n=1 Tax=Brachionus plicatilis TaxID=10195 RepID=A0A3M7T9J6_BRAPC|nr:hypothetical protein BpHYR1_010558 [Brachionus plicatilis]